MMRDTDHAQSSSAITRRAALKLGAASALAGVASALPRRSAWAKTPAGDAKAKPSPRNILFMVADGMSPGVPAMAEAFSHLLRNGGTQWHELSGQSRVVHGWFDMASLNSLVTDSAAAASAWGSGSRVFNGAVNMLPDGQPLTPLAALAKQRGKAVGLVTTTRITHATPAGFAASVPSRDLEDEIAPQYLNIVDVLLGGGLRHFDPAVRRDRRDVLDEYRAAGYAVCRSRDELLAGNLRAEEKLLGLFSQQHLPYTIDRNREADLQNSVPTLAEMTRIALETLSRSPDGFLLQVEGGRVDHAGHNNDAAALLWDQLAFDEAVGLAVEFQRANPDTLVIITADHGTGNPGINGIGSRYSRSTHHFERLAMSVASFQAMHARFGEIQKQHGRPANTSEVSDILHWGTGIELSQEEAGVIASYLAGNPAPELNRAQANISGAAAQILGNHNGIGWTGVVHTSDWAPILAFGPGSERFAGLLKNTDAFEQLAQLMGIAHRNPRMTPEQAREFAHAQPALSHSVHV